MYFTKLPTKSPCSDGITSELYQIFKKLVWILHKLFPNKEQGITLPNSILWGQYYSDTKTRQASQENYRLNIIKIVQFSHWVISDSLQPHGLCFPVHYQLPELAQTQVHRVGDAIQLSRPLSFPSPPAFNLSQHEGLYSWVSSLHQVAKVLELQLQHQSFQWIFQTDFLWLVGSPCSPRDSWESSPTPQFKSINSLALNLLYAPTLTSIDDCRKNRSFDYTDLCQ